MITNVKASIVITPSAVDTSIRVNPALLCRARAWKVPQFIAGAGWSGF